MTGRDFLTSFDDFALAAPILRAVADANHTIPTPIQSAAIPVIRSGRDLIGIAQTGTGKTAAFALPALHHLFSAPASPEAKSCRVLVLTPTRELANQINASFATYGRHTRVNCETVIGGVPLGRHVRALARGTDVLIATPGRLLDLMRSRAVRLDRVEILVLDEADRMLDMGFIQDIRAIIAKIPRSRQTLFFSATMPGEIADLAAQMLRDPAQVSVTPPASTADRVVQQIVHVERADKPELLAHTLRQSGMEKALVFTRTKHGADKVGRALAKAGLPAEVIHGNKSQSQRERALAAFRSGGRGGILVATDIAARGIDVAGVSHVINYDLPNVPETYVHRIGRTARAGAEGVAVSFCSRDELPFLRAIEKTIRIAIPAVGGNGSGGTARETQQRQTPAPRARSRNRRSRRPKHQPRPDLKPAPEPGSPAGRALSGLPFLQPARRPSAPDQPRAQHRGADLG